MKNMAKAKTLISPKKKLNFYFFMFYIKKL